MENEIVITGAGVSPVTATNTAALLASGRKKKAKDRTSEEAAAVKAYNNAAQGRSRPKVKARQQKAARKAEAEVEVSPKEALRILQEERQIKNQHVAETCIELAKAAAQHFKIPVNAHLFTHGLRATLKANETGEEVPLPQALVEEEIDGEILYRGDLVALHDYGFWRQPDVTFEQWLADRRKLKSSAYELSKILGKADFGPTHESWTSFAPRWNPSGLKPGYTQREALAWLNSQRSDTEGDKKRYLLVASRNSMKSTWVRILCLALTITCPDAPILYVTETNKLSRKAMKELKGYLEIYWNSPTLFQQYFAEVCVEPDSQQAGIYDNPLAHLGLPQHSIEQTSGESSNTGSRFWLAVFDDFVSRDYGTSNEEQREAAIARFGAICKLRDPQGAVTFNVQTPWVLEDLGDVMIRNNDNDPERPLAVRIDPVMEIKAEAKHKPLLMLTEEDVVLNFLPKLNWRFVRDEMRSPEGIKFFQTQYLCEWVPDDDSQIKLNFDRALLMKNIIPQSAKPAGEVYLFGDVAHSQNKYADNSVLGVILVHKNQLGERSLCVLHMEADRMRASDFALNVVKMTRAYQPRSVIIEKGPTWDLLQQEILRVAGPTHIPLYWSQPSNKKDAKLKRLKALETCIVSGRMTFLSGMYIDALFSELERLDGKHSSGRKKDDRGDVLGLAQTHLLPAVFGAAREEDERSPQEKEREEQMARTRAHHRAMFPDNYQPPKQPEALPPPRPPTAREAALAKLMAILPPGLRNRGQR